MKVLRKLARIFILVFVLLFISSVGLSYVFSDKIFEQIIRLVNEQIEGEFKAESVNLSFIKSFPRMDLNIYEPLLTSNKISPTDTLINADHIGLTLNLSVLWNKSKITEFHKVSVENPRIHIRIDQNGVANYDILKTDSIQEKKEDNRPMGEVRIDKIEIVDGNLIYEDDNSKIYTSLSDLNHTAEVVIANGMLNYKALFTAMVEKIELDGSRYYSDTHIGYKGDVNVDLKEEKYSFLGNEIVFQELPLRLEGWFLTANESRNASMDLSMDAPTANFKELFSLVPALYIKEFQRLQANGRFDVSAKIMGDYSDENYPSMDIRIEASKGTLSYPDIPEKLENIALSATFQKPQGDLSKAEMSINTISALIDRQAITGSAHLKNLTGNIAVDGKLKGMLDLGLINKFFDLSQYGLLDGKFDTDMVCRFTQDQISKEAYEDIDFSGTIKAQNVIYQLESYPAIYMDNIVCRLAPDVIEIDDANLSAEEMKMVADLRIEEPFNLLSEKKLVKISTNCKIESFNTNKWLQTESGKNTDEEERTDIDGIPGLVKQIQLSADVTANRILYEEYTIEDARSSLVYAFDQLKIKSLKCELDGQPLQGQIILESPMAWIYNSEKLKGDLSINTDHLDLNKLLGIETTDNAISDKESDAVPTPLPTDMDINIKTIASTAKYENMNLRNAYLDASLSDGKLTIKEMKANTLGGFIKAKGVYYVKNQQTPYLQMSTTLDNIEIQQAYSYFNTVKALSPIAQYIKGNFNTEINFASDLKNDYSPVLQSISLDGLIETFNAFINDFKPLNLVSGFLQIGDLRDYKLQDSRNKIHVNNGTINVDPFKLQLEDYSLDIKGSHTLDHQIDYMVETNIPREKINSIKLNDFLDKSAGSLNEQAAKIGIDLDEVKDVRVTINLTGSFKNPKLSVKLKASGAESLTKKVKETVKKEATEAKDTMINQTKESVKTVLDTTKKEVEKKVEKEVKKALDNLLNPQTNPKDSTKVDSTDGVDNVKNSTNKEIEKIKDKLKDINPFKKKKKDR